jgi:hypothetical protein
MKKHKGGANFGTLIELSISLISYYLPITSAAPTPLTYLFPDTPAASCSVLVLKPRLENFPFGCTLL